MSHTRHITKYDRFKTPGGHEVSGADIDTMIERGVRPLSDEQWTAVSNARSIIERFTRTYEYYGGVNVQECVAALRTIR